MMAPAVDQLASLHDLVRTERTATLATISNGQPHAALVIHATMADFTIALLLSELSLHTKHLRIDPRCALLCTNSQSRLDKFTNPQITPRVSLECWAQPVVDASLRAAFLALHPYSTLYADFGDFQFWRLTIKTAHYVGGFAQAWSVDQSELHRKAS